MNAFWRFDFVSVHVPLLPENTRLFDAPKFYRMKRRILN